MAPEEPAQPANELTEDQKRANLIRLVFEGDEAKCQEFCDAIRRAIPPDTAVVLRGSAVTGRRWRDGAAFDSRGPGTSDLDLTLVGDQAIHFFKLTGFYVPGVHSRPVSERAPEIAPALIPLREQLMAIVGRPVNIQASRDIVLHFRGDLLGQPYLVLIGNASFEVVEPASERERASRANGAGHGAPASERVGGAAGAKPSGSKS